MAVLSAHSVFYCGFICAALLSAGLTEALDYTAADSKPASPSIFNLQFVYLHLQQHYYVQVTFINTISQ